MTTISIIGSGNMATAIGTRATKHGHTIELMSRNTAKAHALADQIGNGPPSARSAQGRRVTSSSWPSCTPARLK
jgi:predicted dinucleotide-binding enzyme